MIAWFTDPLQFTFMQRALLEVVLMGLTCGVIGAYVVLRGMAFLGDALSHAIFPGVVIAFLLNINLVIGALAVGAITVFAIGGLARSRRVSEDSAIGVLFTGAFALGVVLISQVKTFTANLADFLVGQVLGVSTTDLLVSGGVAVLVLGGLAFFHKELTLIAFDREMAEAMGLPVAVLDLALLLGIALTIIVSLQAVGNILVVAMLVTPAAAARLWTDRLVVMMAISATFGVLAGAGGLLLSYHANYAAGGTIVLLVTLVFGASYLFAPRHGLLARRAVRG
ncbi:MAG: metal ABC transporter permease [Chloroflexia bacterium]